MNKNKINIEKPTLPVINREKLNYDPRELRSINSYLQRGRKGIYEYYQSKEKYN